MQRLRYTDAMAGAGVKKQELEKYRRLDDAERFIARVLAQVEAHYPEERALYRLSEGYYKHFKEEYIPIFRYLKHVYGLKSDVMFKHVGIENQPYDGVVKIGGQHRRIEIAYLSLGKHAKEQQQKKIVEENAALSIRDTEELYQQIEKLILDTARKKAKKPYEGTLLVLYYASGEDLYPGDVGFSEERFGRLVDTLRAISYRAEKVHLFLPEYAYTDGKAELLEPARIYVIK